jgi:signal transduction histidine kinase
MSETSGTEAATPSREPPSPRALVVEDDPAWNGIIGRALHEAGLDVTPARTTAEGIEYASAASYDIALIDYVLPGSTGGGIEVAQAVRQASPHAVIIILTGWPNLTLSETAQDVKVDDLLVKGELSPLILQERVTAALGRRRLQAGALNVAYLDTVVYDSLSDIAHELRTPLVAIQWQTEALSSGALGPLSAKQTEAIGLILAQAKRGLNLVTGHLEVTRIASTSPMAGADDVDVVTLLQEHLVAWQPIAAEKRVDLRLDTATPSYLARIDRNVLRIALNPLIENAIKFSPAGGTVSIRLARLEGSVRITVSDEGPGMISTDVGDFTSTGGTPSAGMSSRARRNRLGLTIVRRAAELHGGHLEVESRSTGVAMTLLLQEYSGR